LVGPITRNPPEKWIRCEHAFEPLVGRALFEGAQRRLSASFRAISDDEILARMKALYVREGQYSTRLVWNAAEPPRRNTIWKRLGPMTRIRALLGTVPTGVVPPDQVVDLMRRLERETFTAILNVATSDFEIAAAPRDLTLKVPRCGRLRIHAAQPSIRSSGEWLWAAALPNAERADWNLVIRADVEHDVALDYLLIPRGGHRLRGAVIERDLAPEFRAFWHASLASVLASLPFLSRSHLWYDRDRPSKYRPLRHYLESRTDDVVELSVSEIVQIIGADLPPAAHGHTWWTNGKPEWSRSVQARAWMDAGFLAHFRSCEGIVRFEVSARQASCGARANSKAALKS
jgi:hypothetical protein